MSPLSQKRKEALLLALLRRPTTPELSEVLNHFILQRAQQLTQQRQAKRGKLLRKNTKRCA
jgi:hypothetical protein